jgi:hypothetical protein
MADVAVLVTIVAFFVAAALLTRALDRVIADTDGGSREAGEAASEQNESDAELSDAELSSRRWA